MDDTDTLVFLFAGLLFAAVFYLICGGGSSSGGSRRASSSSSAGSASARNNKFAAIADQFTSLDQIQASLRDAGLESCNLILGIDFTLSNTWTGKRTFSGKSLHALDARVKNPYERVMSVLGRTLEPFDEDRLIPAFGFGDMKTKGSKCFPFFNNRPCNGFEECLRRYAELVPSLSLSGPTNFAPVIYEAIEIVKEAKDYHILVIIADGQVSSPRETSEAIVEASKYPLSIIVIGVGDGPWEQMEEYDDELPERKFDNFQFVDFSAVTSAAKNPDEAFAVHALMEIPEQVKLIKKLGLM